MFFNFRGGGFGHFLWVGSGKQSSSLGYSTHVCTNSKEAFPTPPDLYMQYNHYSSNVITGMVY